ncbi:hypothetical protein [Pectobacterium versatile]|uniref:hypothetical protein n=1 Tax=Pectobacterium versatile TaxID=2488639 RepID=UPI00131A9149|nr:MULTISPECIES: hypothetical protein [Pectobacterium]MCA5949255.1 hypothetical protein [Pectobacterium versatile]UCP88051.1 hypothetical protein LGL96_10860 [Pectobacterium versatile]
MAFLFIQRYLFTALYSQYCAASPAFPAEAIVNGLAYRNYLTFLKMIRIRLIQMGKPINTAEYMESIDSRISANIAKWYSTGTVLSDKKTIFSLS